MAHTGFLFFLCSMNGALAFVDTSDCTIMYIAEHYMASDVEWDPTGRYVVTSVSWWSHKVNWHVHFLLYVYPFFFTCINLFNLHTGGQCILALDIPGTSSAKEQQRQILPVAMETMPAYFTRSRANKGDSLFYGLHL